MENLSKCRECQNLKVKIFIGMTSDNRKKYVDTTGSMWSRNQCPDCRKDYLTRNDRKYGHKSRFDYRDNYIARGVLSEKIAAQFLRDIGFIDIEQSIMHGPDLVFKDKEGNTYSAEVKSVVRSLRMRFVNAVAPKRKQDTYFIAVDNNRVIVFEPMRSHLLKCTKNGQRCVTKEIEAAQWHDA